MAEGALPLDAGLTEADDPDEPQQFRRASRRVPVKRGALPRRIASRLRTALPLALAFAVLAIVLYQANDFAVHSWRFRLRNASDIELAGDAPNSSGPVMEKMREVLGRNIFLISMAERKQELEKIPWVESATVMRLWPNRLRVMVKERTPVAFVAIGGRVELMDAQGVVLELSPGVPSAYSFPVILGMAESDPLSTRAARMKIYARLLHELDGDESGNPSGSQSGSQSAGPGKVQYSRNLDEVDLSDPEDVRVTVKGGSGPVLLHLGNESFLPRFMVFLSNVQKWEQERGKLESVDLRYGRQVILNPDMSAAPANQTQPGLIQPKVAPAAPHVIRPGAAKPAAARPATARAEFRHPKPEAVKGAKINAAHPKPQRVTVVKRRHWRGKKRT